MLVSDKFTPELLLGAPRRGVAMPNGDGSLALYTQSTHTFGDKTTHELRIMTIESGSSYLLTDEEKIHDANWVPGSDNDIIYLKSGDKGVTEVVVRNAAQDGEAYVAAKIDAPIEALKLKALDDGTLVFAVVGLVDKAGHLFNPEIIEKKSTARVFDNFRVRCWDKYYPEQRHTIWYTTLVKDGGKWKLSTSLNNLLENSSLEAPANMINALVNAQGSFDIGQYGMAFIAEDPDILIPALNGVNDVYYVPLDSFSAAPTAVPVKAQVSQFDKAYMATNVRIAPDGERVAFLIVPLACPANVGLVMAYTATMAAFGVYETIIGEPARLPLSDFEWAGTNDALICSAEDCGRSRLTFQKLERGAKPESLLHDGTISAYHPLKHGNYDKLLVTSTNYVDSSLWQVIDTTGREQPKLVSSATKHGAKFGLSRSMIDEIWYEGEDDIPVHSFIIKPRDFDESKQYPWILLPHGGPAAAWNDSWSTRWNMALFAQQGYVLICPNIAGSTGYGVEFATRIYRSWGGAPLKDLERLVDYLGNLPYLDPDRAAVAGASYGGYMVSWMLGHDIMRKFSAAVWHDGIFNLPTFFLQTDFQTASPDFNGMPYSWVNGPDLDKWNPARPELLRKWALAPPTLVIHSEDDYRCPITEGLATFAVLQAHGVTSRFLTFPDENHWVLKPENSLVWHRNVIEWLERFAKKEGPTETSRLTT